MGKGFNNIAIFAVLLLILSIMICSADAGAPLYLYAALEYMRDEVGQLLNEDANSANP
ncbi:hypothetical protein MKW94_013335 [Papaver nudicaule]|uniref:Uncharacterized protein n=1 Tax=Papaver nudicaule TaxID=74823 RepID=A0AA41RTX8_PAPNU|nr:hypothetical protein [Papaver nudicaule]MCL7024021.1 hypothetical protein [Papaver nudicaule]